MFGGKIFRLPHQIREEVNRRLCDGQEGKEIAAWLNGLPEVRTVLASHFNGVAISEQNVSKWKNQGYRAWLEHQRASEAVERVMSDSQELAQLAQNHQVSDLLSVVLASRLAAACEGLNLCECNDEPERWRRLHRLCVDLGILRRGDLRARRLRVEEERQDLARQKFRVAEARRENRSEAVTGKDLDTIESRLNLA